MSEHRAVDQVNYTGDFITRVCSTCGDTWPCRVVLVEDVAQLRTALAHAEGAVGEARLAMERIFDWADAPFPDRSTCLDIREYARAYLARPNGTHAAAVLAAADRLETKMYTTTESIDAVIIPFREYGPLIAAVDAWRARGEGATDAK